MEVTFLGHQGWLFKASSGHKIMLDPLVQEMGNGKTKINVWPNRKLLLEKIGKLDTLIISHEHADHFHIQTLLEIFKVNKPDRVLVPNISTRALKNALSEIGFFVQEMRPMEVVNFGTLSMIPLPSVKSRFEPDVYSLFFEDNKSKSSFYTPIDTVPSKFTIDFLNQYCPRRTLDNYTNNYVQRIQNLHNLSDETYSESQEKGLVYLERFVKNFSPENIIISGQGWSYTEHLKLHNQLMFTLTHADLCKKYANINNINIFEAITDTTYHLKNNTITKVSSDFTKPLKIDDRSNDYSLRNKYKLVSYCQIKNTLKISNFVKSFIENDFGKIFTLGASKLNKALYNQIMENNEKERGLFIELRGTHVSYQYEYSYSDSTFYPLLLDIKIEEAKKIYAFGIVGFITDFYEIIQGHEEGHLVSENSMITWNSRTDLLNEATDIDFINCFRPQFFPLKFEKFYINEIKRLKKNGN